MEKTITEKEENKFSPLQWFLYVFVIPLLALIVVASIVLSIAGVDVMGTAKETIQKVPGAQAFFKEEEVAGMTELEDEIIDLKGQIKDREAKVANLESQLETKDKELDRSELEKEQLNMQIDELTAIRDENKRAFTDILRTYETMSPKKSAPVISAMKDGEALEILTNINSDILAKILENLDSATAARYTELLTNEAQKEE